MAGANYTFVAVISGTAGNAISIALTDPLAINQPLTVSVAGSAITVLLATDGAGALTSTYTDVVNAINASAAASALVVASAFGIVGNVTFTLVATFLSGGAGGAALTGSDPPCKITLYDAAYRALSQAPVMVTYVTDPDPFGPQQATGYLSGAVVPPLLYPQFSNIRFDITSLLSAGEFPLTLDFQLRGVQRFPC